MKVVLLLGVMFSCHEHVVIMDPVIRIKDGTISGKFLTTKGGRTISAFMGIPFAKPPIGSLRFEPPQPVDPWKDIWNGTTIQNICPQRNVYIRGAGYEGVEDCLYLNVYTPKVAYFETHSLPVMVFFHGGGFVCLTGNYNLFAPEVLLDRDVIVVTTNFRLGALGFFTTGDKIVPGNNGLKDQTFVLKWVKKNIKHFGGNRSSVTIFGESAGGASVHYHMLSPLSRGLFNRGILQSGTALASWTFAGPLEGRDNSRKLAQLFNCTTNSSQEMVKCLKKVDANEILKKDEAFQIWDYDPTTPFKPVIEPNIKGAFLVKHPRAIIESGEAADVPIIIGVNRDEGALKTAGMYNSSLMEEFGDNSTTLLPVVLQFDKWFLSKDFDTITKRIYKFYFKDGKIDNSKIKELTELISDGLFFYPNDVTIRLHTMHYKQPVYVYLLGYRGSLSLTGVLGGGNKDFGVCHVDDLIYLFPLEIFFGSIPRSESDKRMTNLWTKLWTNFASTGNPTPNNKDGLAMWRPYDVQKGYYEFTSDASAKTVFGGIAPDRMSFWRQLICEYGSKK